MAKTCARCGLPFEWRRKWANNGDRPLPSLFTVTARTEMNCVRSNVSDIDAVRERAKRVLAKLDAGTL